MRIGVLGLGRIGATHARNLLGLASVDAVVGHDPAGAGDELVAAGLRLVASGDELLAGVDGVVICTPTANHPDDVRAAADLGLPIFCEKPISLELATTDATLDHVAAAGVELQVGFQRRFEPGFVEMRRLIESGALGDLYVIRAASHDFEPPHESYLPKAGSIFRDMHIHDFDAIRWLSGREVVDVYARGSVLVDEMFARHNDVDTTAAVLTLEGGALAVLTGARDDALGYDHRTEVFGSKDSVIAGLNAHTPLRSVDADGPAMADPYPSFPVRFGPAYLAEMEAFVAVVAGEGPNRSPGISAREALRLAIAADRSLAEGRAVAVAEIV
ncbi:MAG: Gfo/Idh/MocA family protein [Acidimicrobiales bacterium]